MFFFSPKVLTNNRIEWYYSNYNIMPFRYSIIPGWNKQDGWLEIPYYQQWVEFPLYYIEGVNHARRISSDRWT